MKSRFLTHNVFMSSIFIACCLLLSTGCAVNVDGKMIVSPSKDINEVNRQFLIDEKGYEEGFINTENNEKLYYLKRTDPQHAITLLVLHGNALNLTQQPWFGTLEAFSELDANIVAIDYRGFGLSSGEASLSNMIDDAVGAMQLFEQDEKVVLYGMSLGSVMATSLLEDERVHGIVLEGAVTNVQDMVALYKDRNLFGGMTTITLDNAIQFDNAEKLQNTDKPVLIVHGKEDQNIPWEMGKSLYDASNSASSRLHLMENVGHCNAFKVSKQTYLSHITEFITTI